MNDELMEPGSATESGICYYVSSQRIKHTNVEYSSALLTIVSIISFLFLLWKLNKSYSRSSQRRTSGELRDVVLPAYFGFILLVCVFYVVVIFYNLGLQEGSLRSFIAAILNTAFTFLTVGLVVFLLQGTDVSEDMRWKHVLFIAGVIAVLRLGPELYICISVNSYYSATGWTPFGDWTLAGLYLYWLWLNVIFTVVYTGLWIVSRVNSRKAAEIFIIFMLIVYVLFTIGRALLQSGNTAGWCFTAIGHVCYHLFFAPVLYIVVMLDSRERIAFSLLQPLMLGKKRRSIDSTESDVDSWKLPGWSGRPKASLGSRRLSTNSLNIHVPPLDYGQDIRSDSQEGERILKLVMQYKALHDFIIPSEDIMLGDFISSGSYGEVFEARWHGTDVAVKYFHLRGGVNNIAMDERILKEFLQEAKVMSKLRHPNIVQFFGVIVDKVVSHRCLILVMELMDPQPLSDILSNNPRQQNPAPTEVTPLAPATDFVSDKSDLEAVPLLSTPKIVISPIQSPRHNGQHTGYFRDFSSVTELQVGKDLEDYKLEVSYVRSSTTSIVREKLSADLKKSKEFKLTYLQALRLAAEVAQGMIYLHSRNVVHRDLKPHNVLVDNQGRAKIADFGLSRVLKKAGFGNSRTTMGTPEYLSPEIIAHEKFSKQSDVYAFAIILWELISRETPYVDWRSIQIIMNVTDGMRPDFPKDIHCPIKLKRLVEKCWSQEAKDRPDFSTILRTLDNLMHDCLIMEGIEETRKRIMHQKRVRDLSHRAVSPARFHLPSVDPSVDKNLPKQKLPRGLSGSREKRSHRQTF